MSAVMFYAQPVLLDRQRHRTRRVRVGDGFGFARSGHAMALAATEFKEACKEYTIVFTRGADGVPEPAVLLGLRERENLFVDEQGRWDARYVPAFARRYPFVLAKLPGQEALGVCIDEAFPGLNEHEGEALFDAQGQQTPYLRRTLDFLEQFQREHLRTQAFCQRLHEADVLTTMNARAELPDGRAFTVEGLSMVDENKLRAMDDARVLQLFRAGELDLITMHLLSLSNMQRLLERLGARPADPSAGSQA